MTSLKHAESRFGPKEKGRLQDYRTMARPKQTDTNGANFGFEAQL